MYDNQNPALAGSPAQQPAGAQLTNPISAAPAADGAMPTYEMTPAPAQPASVSVPGDDVLLDIKKQALTSLTPLVDKLDQSPEEKFKTTMMLIQASDNSGLIKQAYEAASQIPDEKARAQALIDVINEINYFTHQHEE